MELHDRSLENTPTVQTAFTVQAYVYNMMSNCLFQVQPPAEEPVEQPAVEQPVEAPATAVHLTAAGKAAAAKTKKEQPRQSNKMTIEEVDAPKPDAPAAVEPVERVPIVEPVIVKEEATLLYEGGFFRVGEANTFSLTGVVWYRYTVA